MLGSVVSITGASFDVSETISPNGTVELKTIIDLSTSGVSPAGDAFHGNHQTRTVHTSHGDYNAYVTGTYVNRVGKTINQWSIIKVNAEDGTAAVIFTGEQQYDSSQVSLLVDKYENVWAVTTNSYGTYGEGLYLSASKVDAKTDTVTTYKDSAYESYHKGCGYGMSFYDPYNERIICMHAGGDYVSGSEEGGSLSWTIFDIKTETWDENIYSVLIPARHCYFYGSVDKNGGLMIMGQRDVLASSLGYPEVGNNNGLTNADYQVMEIIGVSRWAADYCWDALDLYYIPDIYEEKAYSYSIAEADYSHVQGTPSQRSMFSYRMSNYYPTNQNNNGGDYLWTETDDGRTLLHITYNSGLTQAAMDRSKAITSTWYHQVWDITDPTAAQKIYSAPITIDGAVADDVQLGYGMCFRLYRDVSGDMYLISSFKDSVSVYCITESDGGYVYNKVGDTVDLNDSSNIINISSHRGGSVESNTINLLYSSSGKYMFAQITVDYGGPDPEPYLKGDLNKDDQLSASDLNLLIRIVAGALADSLPEVSDFNSDGVLSSKDVNMLKKALSGQ